jgi:imidazolonepropionase-like amidohydrolase
MKMLSAVCLLAAFTPALAQVAIKGSTVYTMTSAPLRDGVVLIENGKIKAVGPASSVTIPSGWKTLEAAVVTPGLIDAHGTVGLSGLLNGKDQAHDQEQLEGSSPIQPELRAIDAYNPLDPLVAYLRSFGVTTVHTGHAPGETVSGGTILVKLHGTTVEEALIRADVAVAATIGPGALKGEKSPGTRGKQMAMLRAELTKAQEYLAKQAKAKPDEPVARDLKLDVWVRVLKGELPLMITAQRAQDIDTALRLAQEFKFKLWLDGGSESYLLADALKQAGVPVIARPSMMRAVGEQANATVELPALLRSKGVSLAMGSGYESYVPKTRVILFEAALAAVNGLGPESALAMITRDAAQLLGVSDRVGTLQPGKDADIAMFDGDPFEYTTHCVGTLIDGTLEFQGQR